MFVQKEFAFHCNCHRPYTNSNALTSKYAQRCYVQLQPLGVIPDDIDLTKKPSDWRERMKQRQKFWSHSTGFKFGRKLADWGKDAPHDRGSGEASQSGMTPEEEEIQRAIALSLEDIGGIFFKSSLFHILSPCFT